MPVIRVLFYGDTANCCPAKQRCVETGENGQGIGMKDNSDSQRKVRLGRKWADCAGPDYKYYMVFDEKDTGFEGTYKLSEFLEIMKQIFSYPYHNRCPLSVCSRE